MIKNTIKLYFSSRQASSNISTAFKELILPRLSGNVLDVGFGNSNHLRIMKRAGFNCIGIVGRDGGYTVQAADACVIVPTIDFATITPHTEAFQAIILHLIVSYPKMKETEMKWESMR